MSEITNLAVYCSGVITISKIIIFSVFFAKKTADMITVIFYCYQAGPLGLLEKCTLWDKIPLALCVIELVFDEKGHGVDFVFRYCNEMMADVEGIPISEMINRSFYEVFENGDKKWLVTYADVALNGNKHTLTDYSPEIDKHLTIYCYQPIPGYCACILIPK